MNKKDKEEAHNSLFKLIHYPEDEAFEFTKKQLEIGVPVNLKNSSGFPATHVAMVRHCPKTVMYLLEKGADVNAKDSDSATLLHYAAAGGYPTIVKYLLNNGANPNAKAIYDLTPALFAAGLWPYMYTDSLKLIWESLIVAGVDINAKDSDGNTALFRAILTDEDYDQFPGKNKSAYYESPQIRDNGNLTLDKRHKLYTGGFRELRGLYTSKKSEIIRIMGTDDNSTPLNHILYVLKPLFIANADATIPNKFGMSPKEFVEIEYKRERETHGENCKLLDKNPIGCYKYYPPVSLFNGNKDIEPTKN